MKRAGGLLPLILERENFVEAAWKAARGKRGIGFFDDLDGHIGDLIEDVANACYRPGPYNRFFIYDPKKREINAPCFRDRVLHHAIMNVCEPILENRMIFDTYACRRGKGQQAAVLRGACYSKKYPFFLKMDVQRFFDSIHKQILTRQLTGIFREKSLLELFETITNHYRPDLERGLPIGSLTSQHLANQYLAPLDRFVKETLKPGGYVRYMDDFVLWHDDRGWLRDSRARIVSFMDEALALKPKPEPFINRTLHGLDFLGYRLFPVRIRLARKSKRRFKQKIRQAREAFAAGQIAEIQYQRIGEAICAATRLADCRSFRRVVLFGNGTMIEASNA